MPERIARQQLETAGDVLPLPFARCYWLLPGRLLAGAYPAAHLLALGEAGVTEFIDLTSAGEGLPGYSGQLAPGQHWQRLGIGDFGVPSTELMRQILRSIDVALGQGRCLYLHCHAGIGRTGTVAGCWLVEQGLSATHALELIARKRQALGASARLIASPENDAQRAVIAAWQAATD